MVPSTEYRSKRKFICDKIKLIFASSFSLSLSFFCISEVVEALEMHFPCHGEKINLSFHSTCHSDDLKQVKTNFSSKVPVLESWNYWFSQSQLISDNPLSQINRNFKKLDSLSNLDNQQSQFNQLSELEIKSDNQYWLDDNVFIAKGQASLVLNGGILEAEFIKYNRTLNQLVAEGNVRFIRGGQYFEAKIFQYDFGENTGYANNVYGSIDLKTVADDIDSLKKEYRKSHSASNQIENIFNQSTISFKVGDVDERLDPFRSSIVNSKFIRRWRFIAESIHIHKSGWTAEEIIFTNDPLNPPQLKIQANGVYAKLNKDKESYTITPKSSKIIVDNRIVIPLGRRTISKEQKKWISSFDFNDRDGFYISRNFQPVKFGDDFSLSLKPQFLLQRFLKGHTNSYPMIGENINTLKVRSHNNTYDLLGLDASINSKIKHWNFSFDSNISTFNPKRFAHGIRYYAGLTRKLKFSRIDNIDMSIFSAYRLKTKNGSLGDNDIYNTYGVSLSKANKWNSDNLMYQNMMNVVVGKYKAESIHTKNFISALRSEFSNVMSFTYVLWKPQNRLSFANSGYTEIFPTISRGLSFKGTMHSSVFFYEGFESQALKTFSAGPELTLGRLESDFFNYTSISIMPSLSFRSGQSPFKFDNKEDLKTIQIALSQHLIGPLLISSYYDVNIDTDSELYGKTIDAKLALIFKRRAYESSLFYDINNKSGGIMFRINGFNFDGSSARFD